MAATGPGSQAITGKEEGGSHFVEAAKVTASRIKKEYESHEFVLPNASVNLDFKANQTAFRPVDDPAGGVPRAHLVIIRTDQTIEIRLNGVAKDIITITSGEGSISLTVVEVTNIFLTVPGAVDANVKILLS